jgi:hypothetical protein
MGQSVYYCSATVAVVKLRTQWARTLNPTRAHCSRSEMNIAIQLPNLILPMASSGHLEQDLTD